MRPISHAELIELARELPHANQARDRVYHVMRRPDYRDMYRYDLHRHHDWHTATVDKVTFEQRRGNLDGTVVWYWTYNGVIARVDV